MPAIMFDMGLFDRTNKMHRIALHAKIYEQE